MVSSQNEEDLLLLFFGEKRVSVIFLATMGTVNIDKILKEPKNSTFCFSSFRIAPVIRKELINYYLRRKPGLPGTAHQHFRCFDRYSYR